MATPKERLREAAHKLAGQAEFIEDVATETHNGTCQGGQGEVGRDLITEALGKVKEQVKTIEEIIK